MPDAARPPRPTIPTAASPTDVIELLRAAHSSTPLHQLLGLQFVAGPDPAVVVVEMPVAAGAFNGSGNLHGGAIATLVDVASGSAAARAGNVPSRARTRW